MPINVTLDNFVRAETDRMFTTLLGRSGLNAWRHEREPAAVDDQPVIRMNQDTLYSIAIVDISNGATLSLPSAGGRYLSAMVVNQDHYVNEIFHAPGDHRLTVETFDSPYVAVAVRILVDPNDPADVKAVNALQDRLRIEAGSA